MVVVVVVVCVVLQILSASRVYCEHEKQGIIPLNATLFANATTDQTSYNPWLSANATFALGFFTPGASLSRSNSSSSSSNSSSTSAYILAIWFQNISSSTGLTIVWMANRDSPVNALSYFRLTESGQFVLFNGSSGAMVWSSSRDLYPSSASSNSNVSGEFQASGNLVLRNQTSNDVLWQSFDHPTDTILPGQRFSLTTASALRSWQTPVDPSTGNFLLVMNSSNNLEMYFVLTGAKYWTSDQFSLITFPAGSAYADFNQTGALNIAVNSTVLESYKASDYGGTNLQRRLTLNSEGNFVMYSWSEAEGAWAIVWRALSDACQVRGDGICTSPNMSDLSQYVCSCPQGFLRNNSQDWTQGCFRQIPLPGCNNNSTSTTNASLYTVQMHSFDNVNYLGPASFIDQVASREDCGALCLQNCSCVCASYGSDRVCWIHSDMQYGAQSDPNQTYTFLLKLAQQSSTLVEGPAKQHDPRVLPPSAIAGTCFAALAATILFILLAWCIFRKREQSRLQKSWSLRQRSGLPIKFSYKELDHATDHFNLKHKLGSGGFGTVFKGILAGDKSTVAVKKLHSSSEGGEGQFQAEVSTIGSIHHVNIVRLRGFCCEGSHRILVYEYMQKGSLDRYLLDKSRSIGEHHDQALDWKTRFDIALGVAKGIAYCHEQCRSRIIHCDIKPENVLLEDDYSPKVSDFGLAKLVSKSQTRVVTAIRGTRGYVAPEWVANLPVTVKADVYSYGMLLLEVIGWRRNLDLCVDSLDKSYYPHWAFHHLMQADLLAVANDARIAAGFDEGQLQRALQVAFWCIQDESSMRPSMGTVVQMLEGTLPVSKPPPPKVLEIVMHEFKDDSIKEALDDADLIETFPEWNMNS